VAAFGRPAGSVGAALGVLQWVAQRERQILSAPLQPFETEEKMVEELQAALKRVNAFPRVIVLGALGRCGQGASNILQRCGIPAANLFFWDLQETKKGGPFAEILDYDIMINCIYLSGAIPPFLTHELLVTAAATPPRRLTVVVDVSCDTSNPYNPLPIYKEGTTLASPVLRVATSKAPALDVIAIDHLPTLLPRESSNVFSRDLLPHILQLNQSTVWTRARELFHKKVALIVDHVPPQANGHSNGHAHHHPTHLRADEQQQQQHKNSHQQTASQPTTTVKQS